MRQVDHLIVIEIGHSQVRCAVIHLHTLACYGVETGQDDIGGEYSETA